MSENKIKLKNCPCCGGKAEIQTSTKPDGHCYYRVIYVKCTECGMKTRELISDGYYDEWHTPEEAAELWNRRDGVYEELSKPVGFIMSAEDINKILGKKED